MAKRDDTHPPCGECGELKSYIYVPYAVGFILTGWDFPSKNLREKKYRSKRSKMLDKRAKERYGKQVALTPNVNGERVDNWSDAKQLAKEKGHDTTHYDAKVSSLKGG